MSLLTRLSTKLLARTCFPVKINGDDNVKIEIIIESSSYIMYFWEIFILFGFYGFVMGFTKKMREKNEN